jgi:DNA primase
LPNDYEHIKERLDLQTVITQETGLKMKGHHLEECPFCQGHECFSIKDRHYKCYQCPAAGDVFTFLEVYKKIDKSEVLKKAAQLAGITLKATVKPKDSGGVNLTIKETIFIEAANHYHANISRNGGKAYLIDQRGHTEDVLNKMKVGWSFGDLVEYLRSKGFKDEQIKASGLAREKKIEGQDLLVDFFKKGIAVFPHWSKGKVLHFTMKDPEKKLMYQLPNDVRSKDWKFYNQAALGKFSEIILVEGENDTLSIIDNDVENVIGAIGSIADYQVKALKTYCASKHLYLWFDNDKAGRDYVRKICTELAFSNSIRIIVSDENFKDPDEYIRAFDGDRKKEIKRLQSESVDYVSWEISEISKLENLELRLKALKDRKIFAAVADMVEAEKLVFIEKITTLGFSKESIEEQLEVNQDLRRELSIYFEKVPKKDADPNFLALMIYKHLSMNGRFFRDSMSDTYLLYQHHIYQIGNNRPFNALMKKYTGLLPTKEPGRSVWESIASEAYNAGRQIDLASWIYTDRTTDTVYINLNSPNNMILRVNKDGIDETPNGLNKEGILLKSSKKILPVNFLPDADIHEGMTALKELIFNNLTCEKEQRYLIICWLMSAFLLEFAPYMGLMKFSGPTESGKTTAARLLSLLIYGNEHLGDPSTAAAYAVSAQNPLLIIDNLEHDDFTKSILKFLLLSATKGGKEKRTQGTDTDTIQEKPKALVLITAIEPFTKAELINRTYDIDFSSKNKADDFIEDEVIRAIVKKRDLIMSAVLKFIQKEILSKLEKRKDFIVILKKEFKNHSKNRTDEFIATLMLLMEKLLKYMPYYDTDDALCGYETGDKEIRQAWITYQDAKARETETSSNTIIQLLDGMMREYLYKMKDQTPVYSEDYKEDVYCFIHPEYGLEVIKTLAESIKDEQTGENYVRARIEFMATSSDIVDAFNRFCKTTGIKNPYHKASVFVSRLRNDLDLLKRSGWEVISREGFEPYYTRVHGERFWKFRKILIK